MPKTKILSLLLAASAFSFVSGCAVTVDDSEPGIGLEDYIFVDPILSQVTPTSISLGQSITVYGSNFIPSAEGQLVLKLDGQFADSQGESYAVNTELVMQVENPGLASVPLNDVIFHPQGDDVGVFRGNASLISRRLSQGAAGAENEKRSDSIAAAITIEPSIRVTRLRSVDSPIVCTEVTPATSTGQNIEIGIQGLGFGAPSVENPWTVKFGFWGDQLDVNYIMPLSDIIDEGARFWPISWIDPEVDTNVTKKVEGEGLHTFEMTVDQIREDGTISIDPSRNMQFARVNPSIEIGGSNYQEILLGGIRTGKMTHQGGRLGEGEHKTANIILTIINAQGQQISRAVNWDIYAEYEISNNVRTYIRERYAADAVSECQPCDAYNPLCRIEYSDSKTIRQERSFTASYSNENGSRIGSQYGPFNWFSISSDSSWEQSFGQNYTDSYSSDQQTGNSFSVEIPPTLLGQSYHQLVELEKRVDIIFHNACGVSGVVGEAINTDWLTGFQVASGNTCPTGSSFPPAQSYDPPVPYNSSLSQ